MYCKNELFSSAIDFSDSKASWQVFSDPLTKGIKEEKEHLIQIIKCSALVMKDPQIENILE
jgi:peptide methionine sulfoxide reductase MsrB